MIASEAASVQAATLVRDAIIDGRLKPGQRLKEAELARQFGISRTPVREALLILQTEGMLVSARNRGATVHKYTPEDLADMYNLRSMLEGYAAFRAAQRISKEDLERLDDNTRRFGELDVKNDLREVMQVNLEFHDIIVLAAQSPRLTNVVRGCVQMPLVYAAFAWYTAEQKRISGHYHARIVEALTARDSQRADFIMREHVYEARDLLVAGLEKAEMDADATSISLSSRLSAVPDLAEEAVDASSRGAERVRADLLEGC